MKSHVPLAAQRPTARTAPGITSAGEEMVMRHLPPRRFWVNWLSAASLGVALFGLALVAAPARTRQGFSWLVYASPGQLDGFGAEAARYIALAHAVLGGVMAGWGAALWLTVRGPLAQGQRVGWNIVAASLGVWFVPDTTYSLASGYWQNAVLNSVFLVLFGLPLWATRPQTHPAPEAIPSG